MIGECFVYGMFGMWLIGLWIRLEWKGMGWMRMCELYNWVGWWNMMVYIKGMRDLMVGVRIFGWIGGEMLFEV